LQLFKNYYNKYNNIKQMEVAWVKTIKKHF
jgi:hypothetical protein